MPGPATIPSPTSVAISIALSTFRQLPRRDQGQRIADEFSQLQRLDHVPSDAVDVTFKTSLRPGTIEKNRYSDVLANQHTIYPPPSTGHYMNGNLIAKAHFDSPCDFVAHQAPLERCLGEFWEIVASSKTPLIVNLTRNVEGSRVKAHQYWPNAVNETGDFGGARVTLLSLQEGANCPVKECTLRRLRHEASGHEVDMLHFEGWPDFGVPSSTEGVRSILDFVERVPNEAGAPIFVHCSAGIGRTGTLIAAFTARQMLRRGHLVDDSIKTIVATLKSCRCGMVQRREQYAFVHMCVMEDIAMFESQLAANGVDTDDEFVIV